jgi:transcriptional regulator with XRE-family HTH domain
MPVVTTVRQDGAAIRRLRERKGLTSEEFAGLIPRLTGGALRHIELETRRVSVTKLVKIAAALGVDLDDLIKADPDDADDEDEPEAADEADAA